MKESISILKANARGLEVFGLREYVSLISAGFQTPTQRARPDAAGARWVYAFKKSNADSARVEVLVRGMAKHLGCDAIVAIPASGPAANNLQRLFGMTIKRIAAVATRKRNHSATLEAGYAESYQVDWTPFVGKRVLLLDDVASTGVTLLHFVEICKKNGIECVAAALGLNYRLDATAAATIEVETPDPVTKTGGGWRWLPLAQVEEELGTSVSFLRKICRHAEFPLEYQEKSGKWCVQKNAVKDWLKKNQSSRLPKLKESLDYDPQPATKAADTSCDEVDLDSAEDDDFGASRDPWEMIRSVNTNASDGLEREKLKILKAETMRRLIDSEMKRRNMIDSSDVVKMIRSFGELFCHVLEETCRPSAADLVRRFRTELGIDLIHQNCSVNMIVARWLSIQANEIIIPAVKRHVAEQVNGVQILDFEANVGEEVQSRPTQP